MVNGGLTSVRGGNVLVVLRGLEGYGGLSD